MGKREENSRLSKVRRGKDEKDQEDSVADLDKHLSGFLYGRGPIFFWQCP